MKKQPIVYVPRELYKRGHGQSYYTYGYVVSKAYLKSKTETYLDDGRVNANYEVEYTGYDMADEHLAGSQYMVAQGYYIPKSRVYSNHEDCKKIANAMNESLVSRRISTLDEERKAIATEEYKAVKRLIAELQDAYLFNENQIEAE